MESRGRDVLFYRLPAGTSAINAALPSQFRICWWAPGWCRIRPPSMPLTKGLTFWIFDRVRIFNAPGYAALLIYDGNRLIHRACIFPRFFRFPFMGANDLQAGYLWTADSHRGRGIATASLSMILARLGPKTTFWYLSENSNPASIKVAEANGFSLVGRGAKLSRIGLRALGHYSLEDSASPNQTRLPPGNTGAS